MHTDHVFDHVVGLLGTEAPVDVWEQVFGIETARLCQLGMAIRKRQIMKTGYSRCDHSMSHFRKFMGVTCQILSNFINMDIMVIIEVIYPMLLTREELQERLIALHQASLELVKDTSLETLLKRIATVACEQVNARYAAVGVLDDEGNLEQFIPVGMTEDEVKRLAHPPSGLGLIGVLMDREDPIRQADLTQDPRSVGFPPHHPKMRSFLGVPIRTADRQLGQIYLTEKKDEAEFTPDDEKIIQMLAAYASAAIQNARLYQHLRERDAAMTRRAEDSAFLNDIASTLTSSLERDEILNKTLALVMNYMKVESGEIFLLDDDKHSLELVLHRGQAAEAFWNRSRFRIGEGLPGLVAKTGDPIVSGDLANDARFLRDAVVQAGFHQIACLPLKASGNLVGVLNVATRGQVPFDAQDVRLLSAVGNWAGLAIENARLHQNARRLAVLEERERIGMDLHDGIIQSIYGVGLAMENVSHMLGSDSSQAKNRIKHVIEDLNHIIRDIRRHYNGAVRRKIKYGLTFKFFPTGIYKFEFHLILFTVNFYQTRT